jgi:hypothetical protein
LRNTVVSVVYNISTLVEKWVSKQQYTETLTGRHPGEPLHRYHMRPPVYKLASYQCLNPKPVRGLLFQVSVQGSATHSITLLQSILGSPLCATLCGVLGIGAFKAI